MEKTSLRKLFAESIFRVPDYQRGYAWEEKQWGDFIEDIDALVDKETRSHYTGTIVSYRDQDATPQAYGNQRLIISDIVDGQQRLTTTCLYLSLILRQLVASGKDSYRSEVEYFLYSGATCRITLGNSTADLFYSLLKDGHATAPADSAHARRLVAAKDHLEAHLESELERRGEEGAVYLENLFNAITQKLVFTAYALEEECEIGMTFELMNSRGKELSVLELLKNYLMHWVSRNATDADRSMLTATINRSWNTVYTNVGHAGGSEDQCLRIAWTLICDYTPKNWSGYSGFKEPSCIPIRKFGPRTKAQVQSYLLNFIEGLNGISKYYADISVPRGKTELCASETEYLIKLKHAGNIANFLPLLVAARREAQDQEILLEDYIDLLKALERYSYRVFLYNRRRSNAGITSFFSWAHQLYHGELSLKAITPQIDGLIRQYAPEVEFVEDNESPDDWYSTRHLLRYTLFEYELHELKVNGKGKAPALKWDDLKDSTFEHILPQTPKDDSQWLKDWPADTIDTCLHDIGNIVFTQNNSNYRNFEYAKKRGKIGESPSYANSDIRQERAVAKFEKWTPDEFKLRRDVIIKWIIGRWSTPTNAEIPKDHVEDDDD